MRKAQYKKQSSHERSSDTHTNFAAQDEKQVGKSTSNASTVNVNNKESTRCCIASIEREKASQALTSKGLGS